MMQKLFSSNDSRAKHNSLLMLEDEKEDISRSFYISLNNSNAYERELIVSLI
jgi:hypothetical protein